MNNMENLLECKGMSFEAEIAGETGIGKIQVENGIVYLCQDWIKGDSCKDKLGYSNSWGVQDGSNYELDDAFVKNFKLIGRVKIELEPDDTAQEHKPSGHKPEQWMVGDVLTNGEESFTIIFAYGELIIGKKDDGWPTCNFTKHALKETGYKLYKPEPEITELTIEEVTKRLGMKVGTLKITGIK